MFIEILFKMLLFKGGALIYAEHCINMYTQLYIQNSYIKYNFYTHCDFFAHLSNVLVQTVDLLAQCTRACKYVLIREWLCDII